MEQNQSFSIESMLKYCDSVNFSTRTLDRGVAEGEHWPIQLANRKGQGREGHTSVFCSGVGVSRKSWGHHARIP